MRWKVPIFPPPPDWLVWLLFWWAIIPIIACIYLGVVFPDKMQALTRARYGPFYDRWQVWFAWHPVKITDWHDDHEGQWVWLEQVERRLPKYTSWPMRYRTPTKEQTNEQ